MTRVYKELSALSTERRKLFELLMNKSGLDVSCSLIVPQSREQDAFPLSFAQRRLWFMDQLDPGNPAYNILAAVRITGSFDIDIFQRAMQEVVQRHETLRTIFQSREGQPVQIIQKQCLLTIPLLDLSRSRREERDVQLRNIAQSEGRKPFDLGQGPLLRITLVRFDEREHIALLILHHIISDGWSMGILLREVARLYEAFSHGLDSPLNEIPIQYIDYVHWLQNSMTGAALDSHLAYWKDQLKGNLPELKLPADNPRPAVQSHNGANKSLTLPADLSDKLRRLGESEGATLFMTLASAFATLLHKYSGQTDIIIGAGIANRTRAEIEDLIGFFVNLLVLRLEVSSGLPYRNLLKRMSEVVLGAYKHQDLPFEKLVDELQIERNLNRLPLLQAVLVLQNMPVESPKVPGLDWELVEFDTSTTRFDLTLFINDSSRELKLLMQYNADLFLPKTIARMLTHFQALLESIVAQPDIRISALNLVDGVDIKHRSIERTKRRDSGFKSLMSAKPQPINLAQQKLVHISEAIPGESLPLMIQPAIDDLDLVEWAQINRDWIETLLLKYGAMLFRNFNVDSVRDFERFALSICPGLFADNGELPRTRISGKVYTPVEYPSDKRILWHSENTFCPRWPMKIWFYCDHPAQEGGETPIVDSRKVFQLMPSRIRDEFAKKKIMYFRNCDEGLGLSWQSVFQTTSKAKVEEYCNENGIRFIWESENHLKTWSVCRAVASHPKTGDMVWFNQATHWHVSCLESEIGESLRSTFSEESLPRNVYYGDASPIEDSVMEEICDVYQRAEVSFPWQKRDIMMLDNMLTSHARNPYKGPRKMAVAMGDLIGNQDLRDPD